MAAAESCRGEGIALQVLGSGGPIADDGRASTAYVVWIDGESRVLIDAGSGAFLRFGEVGADFRQLDFIGLSHFHTDHSADFPALLKSGFFSGRDRPLAVAGPSGGDRFPSLHDFLGALLDEERGAFPYLSGYLTGSGGLAALQPVEVNEDAASVTVFAAPDGLRVDGMHVPHGIVPALAFRVRIGDITLVLAGDQNGSKASFVDFAKGANLLVMHMAIPDGIGGPASRLHATPGDIGRVAGRTGARKLVLSHFMARSLEDLDDSIALVREGYDGPVIAASDLDCFPLP